MPACVFTSAGVNNLASNALNWPVTGIPVDNDSIEGDAGVVQTIDWDIDMSNAATWPNGCSLIRGAGLKYTFNMVNGGYFKQKAACVADITLACGTSGTPFPFASKATFDANGFTIGAASLPDVQLYCKDPTNRYVTLSANEAANQTILSVTEDVTADPQWVAGASLVIMDNTIGRDVEPLVLVSTTANTITVLGSAAAGGLALLKVAGARIYLEDRNLRVINSPAAGAFTTIKPASYVRGTVTACNRGTHNGLPNAAVLTDTTKAWTVNALIGCKIFNVTDGSNSTVTANTATTVTGVLANGTDNDWDVGDSYIIFDAAATGVIFKTCTGCTFDGISYGLKTALVAFTTSPTTTCSGISLGSTNVASSAIGNGCSGFVLTSTGVLEGFGTTYSGILAQAAFGTTQDITINGSVGGFGTTGCALVNNINFVTSVDATYRNNLVGIYDVGGLYLDTCTFNGCTTAIKSCARVMACNCTTTGGTTDLDTVAGEFFNCTFGSATEHSNYASLQPWMFTGSEQHDGAAGAYAGWSRGGVCVSNVVTVPTGYTRSFQHLYESATLWNLRQYHTVVQPGAKLTVSAWLRKDLAIATIGNRPTVQIIDVMNDPLVDSGNVALASATMTDSVNTWENLSINWINPNTYQMNVLIRILSRDVGGVPNYFYENASIQFTGGGMGGGGATYLDATI